MAWRQGKDKMTQTQESRRVTPSSSLPTGPRASMKASGSPLMLCVNKEIHEPLSLLIKSF